MDDNPRRRDPERTRQALLAAALAEFAAKGRAGARVDAIAHRAGVNKQLISHHFGGKDGLYRALVAHWLEQEAGFASPDLPLAELVAAYVHDSVEHREIQRLMLRESLEDVDEPAAGTGAAELADMRRRQQQGELADDFDPAFVLLILQAAAGAGVMFPADVRRLTGLDPASPEFAARHAEQLKLLVAHLAPRVPDAAPEG
jgi:TetR/AcrR family transcriptional regulator